MHATLLALITACTLLVQDPAPTLRPDTPTSRPDRARVFDDIAFVRDVLFASATTDEGKAVDLLFDAAFPRATDDALLPAVIYIHGGGWVGGSRDTGRPFLEVLSRGGYFAMTIDYRLMPESTYPAAVHDCKAAIRFLRTHHEELGIDPNRIGVMGHSAGAHLATLCATTANDEILEGTIGATDRPSDVACVVDISGPTDLSLGGRRGGRAIRRWLASETDGGLAGASA